MDKLSSIFSIAFFLAFMIYVFFGIYILLLNPKGDINRTFFVICLMLCVWSFSFSIANSASSYDEALFWRRISVVGWGTIYSFILHFILIMTEKRSILEKKKTYFVLYVPALINLLVFSILGGLATKHHDLIQTSYGWVNTAVNGLWDWHFNLYYAGFIGTGIGLVWHWGKSSWDERKEKQSKLIALSFAFALVLGTVTDKILNKHLNIKAPQIAAVAILIPIASIAYAIKRYGLMDLDFEKRNQENGRVLNDSIRRRIYYFLSFFYMGASLLSFGIRYFIYGHSFREELIFNGMCFLTGLSILGIRKLKVSTYGQDDILMTVMSISVFRIILKYSGDSSTIWALPVVLISLSVLLNRRRTIFMLSGFALFIQVWMMVSSSFEHNFSNIHDYIVKLGITLAAMWIALFINRVYTDRLKENSDQIEFQKMVSKVSTEFIAISRFTLEKKVKKMLELSGNHYGADRAYFLLFSEDRDRWKKVYSWHGDKAEANDLTLKDCNIDEFFWILNRAVEEEIVEFPDIGEIGTRKSYRSTRKEGSLVAAPVKGKAETIGFLCFKTVGHGKVWAEESKSSLRILANLLSDAITKVAIEKEIKQMAYYDTLTGLPNKVLYKKRLEKAIDIAKKTDGKLAVITIDLDSFKSVNDTLGHEAGDEMLKQVAKRFESCVQAGDTVSRFGGDEFLIMVDGLKRDEEIGEVADSLMRSFCCPMKIKNQEIYVTASIGIARYPEDGEKAEELIKNSDVAMYSSKDSGKNRYTFCSFKMKNELMERVKLTNSLYRALERDELLLHYQPQISAKVGEVVGVEALIRWNHPEYGMISPGVFIPLAEQTGLINSIGEWVLRTACNQVKLWQNIGIENMRMAVNLSMEQFKNPKLVDNVKNILKETGMDPKSLELEITESVVEKNTDYVVDTLSRLKDTGIMIAIDDFGTEYSSLSRLKMLPADRIKIDKKFVQGLSKDSKDEAVVKTIIQLARNLDFKVIAEGVETEKQLNFLKSQDCEEIQGYYYYKPMKPSEFEDIMIKKRRSR